MIDMYYHCTPLSVCITTLNLCFPVDFVSCLFLSFVFLSWFDGFLLYCVCVSFCFFSVCCMSLICDSLFSMLNYPILVSGGPGRLAPVFLCSFHLNSLNLETLPCFEPQQDLGAFIVLNLESVNFLRDHDGCFFFK